ncbi:hypothetical protein E2C01_089852 [Portunus trituberculatus]|uniref:Uncharacterized protein n=1 Tax=Portunus trituberculatus TaxID=210409 RepID=A0A5B7JJW9_PORTR|nr:hypothetical protein [Portunus trituberculatus]
MMGSKSAPDHDSQPYRGVDISAASNTLRFTTNGTSLIVSFDKCQTFCNLHDSFSFGMHLKGGGHGVFPKHKDR